MEILTLVIKVLAGTFAVAFGLGWFVPLVTAGRKEIEQPDTAAHLMGGLDMLMLCFDCLPIFWIFRAVKGVNEIPSAYFSARKKWAEEGVVRGMFYASCVSFGILMFCIFMG